MVAFALLCFVEPSPLQGMLKLYTMSDGWDAEARPVVLLVLLAVGRVVEMRSDAMRDVEGEIPSSLSG